MGGVPATALQLIGWPRDAIPFEVLGRVLEGGADVMAAAACTIVGGHSIDDAEPKYGFAVTGTVQTEHLITNDGARPGDVLVLTKPLGTGIIATAIKEGKAEPGVIAAAIETMVELNDRAADAARTVGVSAGTDVTGFGLLGHLREILVGSGLRASVFAGAVPLLDGVLALAEAGVYPGGSGRNLESVTPHLKVDGVDDVMIKILADAQTSGGLLLSISPDAAEALLEQMAARNVTAAIIGEVAEGEAGRIEVHG